MPSTNKKTSNKKPDKKTTLKKSPKDNTAKKTNSNLKSKVESVPAWVRSRPQAVRDWRVADKKKKKYRSFRLQKRIKPEPRYVPSALSLLKDTLRFFWQNKRIFIGLLIIHAIFFVIFVRSVPSFSLTEFRDLFTEATGSETSGIELTLAQLGALIGMPRSSGNTGIGILITLLMSLMVVWATREILNKQKIKIRDAVYRGTNSIIPVVLILLVISLQMIPFAVAGFLYATARSGGVFISGAEDLAFFVAVVLIGLLTAYWITGSLIGLYIAALPGVYPIRALRMAKKLVMYRRLAVFRRIFILPILIAVVYFAVILIAIRLIPNQAFWVSDIFSIIMLPIVNIYMYKLYRALL